jgi:hypothetical protein
VLAGHLAEVRAGTRAGVRQHQGHVDGEQEQHGAEQGEQPRRGVVEDEDELEDPGDHAVGQQCPAGDPEEDRPCECLDPGQQHDVDDQEQRGDSEQHCGQGQAGCPAELGGHQDPARDDQHERADGDGHDRRQVGLAEVLGVWLAEARRWRGCRRRHRLARKVMIRMVAICISPVIPAV